jgi:anti-sigma-K factor RskA
MTCEELSLEYGAYALGIAEGDENAEIAAHLARGCETCTRGVRSALATVAALSGAVELVKPPAGLRRRVLALVSPGRGDWLAGWLPWSVTGALAVALLAVGLPLYRKAPDTGKLEQALSILNDPVTRDVSFGEPTARGRVFVSKDKGLVFIAANLPTLATGRTFQLWVIPSAGIPISAGTFHPHRDSSAVYVRPGPVADVAAVALTMEPEGGSPQPTMTPFVVTKL